MYIILRSGGHFKLITMNKDSEMYDVHNVIYM